MKEIIKDEKIIINYEEKSKQKINLRSGNIELLRFFLALLVVFIHTADTWYFPFLHGSVSCFVIISGYFLIKTKDDFRILKFIPTLIFLHIANVLLIFLMNQIFISSLGLNVIGKQKMISIIFMGTDAWWYMWAMIFVYLLAPFLNEGMKKMNIFASAFLIFSFWITFQILGLIPSSYINSNQQTNLSRSYYFGSIFMMFYSYLLGAFLSIHCNSYFRKKLVVLMVSISIIIFSYIMAILYRFVYPNANEWFDMSKNNQSFLSIFNAFAIFSLFKIMNIKATKFILFLGIISVEIFCFHNCFKLFWNAYKEHSHISVNRYLNFLAVLIPTILASFILYYPYKFYSKWMNQNINKLINRLETKLNKKSV